MNIQQLRYVVEVDRTRSITEAAENLFMGQPNLSRAIKELETELGLQLFQRSTRGISTTQAGEEFIYYAKGVLSQFDELSARYHHDADNQEAFRISVPRASYISQAFVRFAQKRPDDIVMEYKETNALRAIRNVNENGYPLGIVRYQATYERFFLKAFAENRLAHEQLWSFRYIALMSAKHPAAGKPSLRLSDLASSIEIVHGDTYVPSLPKKAAQEESTAARVIKVYERGSQFDLLCDLSSSFMWVSPVPERLLDRYGLVQRPCEDSTAEQKDVLIYKEGYHKTQSDEAFLAELRGVRDALSI